jgi:toxin ParE1/3/4
MAQLESRLLSLLDTPYLGFARPDVSPGYRCLPEGKHLIFYRIENELVEVLGVPHMRMDIDRHLEPAKKSESASDIDGERKP